MGRDNHPRERQRRDLERKQERGRARCERILIVSEGSKTEPHYFDEIRVSLRLPTRNITVTNASGTDPVCVVKDAKQLYERGDLHRGIEPFAFDRVFAVFDRDEHHGYFDALQLAEAIDGTLRKNDERKLVPFKSIVSVPNFELWLLLHYENIQAPIGREEALKRLKKYIPGYSKGASNVFSTTREHLETATQRAGTLTTQFTAHDGSAPYTDIGKLVELLTKLRSI